ncbi:pantetheine-phosphate adenylyltransferase [Nocardioides sp. NPDC127514]|uniref:pantetheine-phosphate adenylyltransferase n=1 Tax=unclassified Nocardioides TaxID=2615069 RepID=UPI0013572006
MTRRAVCPGSFDPPTFGHLDIFTRASAMFDEVVVAVGVNPSKSKRLFTPEERMEMITEVTAPLGNVRVQAFTGLVTDFCVEIDAQAIVKGLRGAPDLEYEAPMAQMNAHMTGVETVFLLNDPRWAAVSSSLIKEMAHFGGDVSAFLPPDVLARLTKRLAERSE